MQFSSRTDFVATFENEIQEIFTSDEIRHIDAGTVQSSMCIKQARKKMRVSLSVK